MSLDLTGRKGPSMGPLEYVSSQQSSRVKTLKLGGSRLCLCTVDLDCMLSQQ